VVIGSDDEGAAQAVAALYASVRSTTVICDCGTAEMAKYASSLFLATRVGFINEIASLCDAIHVDVAKVSKVTGMDPRCGPAYLNAGLGWSGSSLPSDVRALMFMARSRDVSLPLTTAVNQINRRQPQLTISKLRRLLGPLQGRTTGLLGLAARPESEDVREASSKAIVSLLERHGCDVRAYDPKAMRNAARLMPNVRYCADAYDVAKGSDALVLVTEWDEFRRLDLRRLAASMKSAVMIDGRNMYDPEEMGRSGFVYEGIGRRNGYARETHRALVAAT
jgi:UDPglucose 6-dehydrogenase